MPTEQLRLKFGTPQQIQNTPYTAGTLYLAKKSNGVGDIYLDVNGTRSLVSGEANINALYDLTSIDTDIYQLNLEGTLGSEGEEASIEERLSALEQRVSALEG